MIITVKNKLVKVVSYNSKEKKEKERTVTRPNKIKDLTAHFQNECETGEVVLSVEELPATSKQYNIPYDVLKKYEISSDTDSEQADKPKVKSRKGRSK